MSTSCIITGGLGFIGQALCRYLLERPHLNDATGEERALKEIILFDTVEPSDRDREAFSQVSPAVSFRSGDISKPEVCEELVSSAEGDFLSVFHLAGIMSGQGEKDFDLCLRVNMDGTRHMLEATRRRAQAGLPTFVFASTAAAYGETGDCPVTDTTKLVPLNTYGMTKVCSELLVNDYTRKGFLNGKSARLPTVVVRPGLPNAATTSCYSGVVREPLHGVDVQLPVARNLPHAVTNTRALLKNIVVVHDAKWPEGLIDRAVTLPSVSTTLGDLAEALHAVVPKDEHVKLGKITDKPDPFLNGVVGNMACRSMKHDRAISLGCVEVPSIEDMVREFIEDYGDKITVTRERCLNGEPASKRVRTS